MCVAYLFKISALLSLCLTVTQQDGSLLSFQPSSVDVAIGSHKAITIRLLATNLTLPVTLQFLYDGQLNQTTAYIDSVPDVTFVQQQSDDQSQVITITGRHEGHLVLTARSSQVNISPLQDFLLIDVAHSQTMTVLIQLVGWIYFVAWSISFYPQIILNFSRRSVIGLNFDFLILNLLGHSCYAVFNIYLYTSSSVQQQYYAQHPHGVLPVLLNDVIFSAHAVFACLVTVGQCIFFERGQQRISMAAGTIGSVFVVFLSISTIVSLSNRLSTLTLLYFFSYVKLAITIIKYVPQAWMNYRRKSTAGWSIGNILLDFTGGALSVLQMFLLAINYNDWSSIFGSPTKFGLGLFSILFDILFIVQHYGLYRTHETHAVERNVQTQDVNEHSPILPPKV